MAIFDQDFLDALTDKLASTGKAIGQKAKEVTDSAKTSLQIAQEEKKLRGAYRQLGMYVYEKSGFEPDEGMTLYFSAIAEAKANIEALKNEQEKEAAEAKAEDDGEEAPAGAESGEEAPAAAEPDAEPAVPEQEPAERVCPMCKSVISAQLIYCPKCGEKLK